MQTVDVFTPVVDEPRDYGRISAANSLSDCYAMGATPATCLSILVTPISGFPEHVVEEILEGANEVCKEAGAPIIGGHSLKLPEPAFGLAVTGLVHPKDVIKPSDGKEGDVLFLTKPIGTGIITTCAKKGDCPKLSYEEAVKSMRMLNRGASLAMKQVSRVSATDITGFGLLGHLHHILESSQVVRRYTLIRFPFCQLY